MDLEVISPIKTKNKSMNTLTIATTPSTKPYAGETAAQAELLANDWNEAVNPFPVAAIKLQTMEGSNSRPKPQQSGCDTPATVLPG